MARETQAEHLRRVIAESLRLQHDWPEAHEDLKADVIATNIENAQPRLLEVSDGR